MTEKQNWPEKSRHKVMEWLGGERMPKMHFKSLTVSVFSPICNS